MSVVLHQHLPEDMHVARALPGIQPERGAWLRWDEAYAGQMARREAILSAHPEAVLYLEERARPAAEELLEAALEEAGWPERNGQIQRPDGRWKAPDVTHPLRTLGHLFQSDFIILQRPEKSDEHLLTGAVLCFPASWSLAEKAGRPLKDIHIPVGSYDEGIARRVQRLFDGVQAGRPLWRHNRLWYHDAELYQPRSRQAPRAQPGADAPYYRSERQTIVRLPRTGACVFVIHTYVLRAEDGPPR